MTESKIKKTYVMIFGIANIVAGGPIYNANKIEYLEQNGWDVIVFPIDDGKIYIEPLNKYSGQAYEFIREPVSLFSKKELKEKVNLLKSKIDDTSDNIVIETGTDYTALWGELLAKELNAKHIIMFLDEKNENVNKYTCDFYRFKYNRNELASISLKSLECIFGKYFELHDREKHVLKACCTNSVKDVECNWIDYIPNADYLIGSIGRLEKNFVPVIVDGICEFSKKVKNKKIAAIFFGGGNEEGIEKKIKEKLEKCGNIDVYITGYLWPIPENAIKKIDVFVSGAGSTSVSANCGVTTIKMDVISNEPMGYIIDAEKFDILPINNKNAKVSDYLIECLLNGFKPKIENKITIDKQWKWICDCFNEHMRFVDKSNRTKLYYPVEKINNWSVKYIIKKLLFHLLGYESFMRIRNRTKNKKESGILHGV